MAGESSTSTSVVLGGGLGGAIATVISWIAKEFFDYAMPPEVASAFAIILVAFGGWIGSMTRRSAG